MRKRSWSVLAVLAATLLTVPAALPATAAARQRRNDFHVVFQHTDAAFTGVSCVRPDLCLAVEQGAVALYASNHWRQIHVPALQPSYDSSVSCTTTGTCVTTFGRSSVIFSVRPHRVRWRKVAIPLTRGADKAVPRNSYPGRSVDCVRVNWCMAVGGNAIRTGTVAVAISIWNGHDWTSRLAGRRPYGSEDGQSVSCWAVGECRIAAFASVGGPAVVRAHILRWSKGELTDSAPFGTRKHFSDFPSLSCTSVDYCIALGGLSDTGIRDEQEETATWNGTTWTVQLSNFAGAPGSVFEPSAVSCLRPDLCTTVGTHFSADYRTVHTGIEVWSGHRWTLRTIAPDARYRNQNLSDVTCVSSARCFAVGGYGTGKAPFGYVQAGRIAQQ